MQPDENIDVPVPGSIAPRRPNTKYPEALTRIAARYGVDLRTVKRWSAIGRKVGELPPVSDPKELAEWWSRHRPAKRVPGNILALIRPENDASDVTILEERAG